MLTDTKKWTIMLGAALIAGFAVLPISAPEGWAADQPIASDNPLSGDQEAIKKGRKTFNTFCAQCHGPQADGVAPRFGRYAADLRRFSKGFYEFYDPATGQGGGAPGFTWPGLVLDMIDRHGLES